MVFTKQQQQQIPCSVHNNNDVINHYTMCIYYIPVEEPEGRCCLVVGMVIESQVDVS